MTSLCDAMKLFGIKNCDSVRKARKWLDAHDVPYQFHDFKTQGLDRSTLENWLETVEWQSLLNQRSTTWRQLDDASKADIDKEKAILLMLAQPALVKRPVLCQAGACYVGFNEQEYQTRYGQ